MTPDSHSAAPSARSPFEDAEIYDALFGDFRWDLDFYLSLAKESRGPVLEVACGTGRVMIPCLEAGVDIDGLDLYPEMLDRLRMKAVAKGLAARVFEGDMRDFALPRRYALAMIPFNGFVHCLTSADQIAALSACRRHLAPGGALVFNVFLPKGADSGPPDGTPVLEHEAPHPETGLPVRIYDTRFRDPLRQVQHSKMEVQELDREGRVSRSHFFETDMRWTYKPELELLLSAAGFTRWDLYGGFDKSLLTRDSAILLVFAWKD
jgi:SAM-dependent methyltransferase